MNIAEPEYSTGRPGGTPTDVWQGGSKLQCSEVVDLHGPAHRYPHEIQSPDEPSQGADRWGCDRFSPSSPSHVRLRDLLRSGSPKTRGLERLREKVRQQRLDAKSAVTPNDPQFTPVTHRGQITRKICRVTFDPPTPPLALRVLSTVGVNSINDDNDPPRGMMSPSMEKTGGGNDVAQTDVGCRSNALAVREAEPDLGPNQKFLRSPMQRKDPNRTGGKQIFMAKPCKPVFRGRSPAPGISNRNLQKSPPRPKPSNGRSNISSSKRNPVLKSPICTLRTPSTTKSKRSPSPSTDEPVTMLERSHTPSKVVSRRSPSPRGNPLGPATEREEAKGPDRPQGPQRCSARDVREFMGQKKRERRRRERQKKEEVQREEEKRKARVQEVLHKQRMALNRANGHAQNVPQVDQGVGVTGPGQSQEAPHSGRGKRTPKWAWQGKGGSEVERVSCVPGRGPGLGSGAHAVVSRLQRVKALRQAAAVLGIRVEEEATRLRTAAAAGLMLNPTPAGLMLNPTPAGLMLNPTPAGLMLNPTPAGLMLNPTPAGLMLNPTPAGLMLNPTPAGLMLNPTPGLTGVAVRPECRSGSDSVSKDLPWTGEPLEELRDTENTVSSASAATRNSGIGVQEPAVTMMRATEPPRTALDPHSPMEGPHTVPGAVEQQHPLEEGRVTPQSKLSDSSDNTDSTSKWSELSGFFGHRELLSHLSLAMSQQSLREEELRARHHSALCRLREEALWEKTQAEIAWLEHRRRCLRAGEEGTLADITKKQEEVVNRMQQEQAEIRHWRNLYRSGRQQRKLLLWQQREVTEIRRSAAQLKQELQEQESAQPAQSWAEPRGSQPSQEEGQSREATPPRLGNPPAQLHHPWGRGTAGGSFQPGGHGLHRLRKGLENDIENKTQDVSEKLDGDRHLESGRKCPTMQRGWSSVPLSQSFSKNPLSDREEKSRASIRGHDLLLGGDVFQDSQTAGQDRDRPAAQPGVLVDMKARSKLSEEGSLERKALEDSLRLGCGMFTAKTDAGLGRLLPSEDGWNWRRRRSATDDMAPAERGELRAPQFGYPGSLDGRSKKVPLPPQKSIHAEGRGRDEEEEGETMAMAEAQPQDYPTAFVSEGRPQTLPPPRVEEESGPPERVSQEEELWSDESSSSGGPLRVRSLPNSAEVSWKSQKSVGSFASLPEFQRAAAVCMNVSEMSGPSSDVEEDLPLDVEDGGWRPAGHINEGDREQCTGAPHEPCLAPAAEPKKGIGNMVALNVRNDQRSQSALTSNNNCEIMPSSCATVAGDCPGVLLQTGTVPGWVNSGPSPGPSSPGPDAGRRDTESSSTDYSLSDTEEGSEVLSSSTEYLISSGEEDPDQAHLGTEAPAEEQGPTHLSHPSGPGASSSARQETSPAIPEVRQLIPEERTSERESGMNIPASLVSPWKPLFLEETLSEILSPVDEVLSYGSTELPPTVTDDLLLPPAPPACEVITWTSEDGFPPPHEEQCEPHPLEDPSIKSDELPSLSDDPLLPVSVGLPIGLTDRRGNDADFLKVDPVTTGYSAGQRSWEGQGKEDVKSLQSAALSRVEEDENTNSSDLLSSFRIGDRVLVCGSRPGQLRFKGTTSFASGHWAGVALDHPAGNHDGMFRGVRYFQCTKNCGVLVRSEDISRLHSEQESDQETRADDPFSDEEAPSANKPPRDGRAESTGKPSGTGVEKCWSQSQGGERSGGAGDDSSAPQLSRDGFPRELNNNPLQSPTPVCEDTLTAPERSSPRTFGGFDPGIHEAQWEEDIQSHELQQGMFEAEKESCLIHLDFWNSMSFTGDLRGCGSPNDLGVGRVPWSCLKGPPDMRTETAPLLLLEQSTSHTPLDCLGSPLEKRERGVRPAPCADPQEGRVGPGGRCIRDLDSLVDRLMGKLLMEVVKEAEEVRTKHRGKRSTLKKENHIQNPQALGKGDGGQVKLKPNPRSSPPCFSDQWRCSLALAAQPRVRVKPHDPGVVHRLVAASVEALWDQTGGCVANSAEAPAYLSGEDSRRTYRQVIFDLTSDIFHEALRCRWGTSVSPWVLKETSPVSPVWSSKTSLSNVKAVIQAEVRRELNLELTDIQTREMLQNLCKYRTAHRDRVDYVLIQELHKEEQQWVDYSHDQLSVKMQLTEEIFDILLQDTISVLNHIYAVPSSDSPPALQPSQSSLIP